MLNDEWDYITKDAIERTADYFKLRVTDVFAFVPVDFWRPIEADSCVFVRGSGLGTAKRRGLVIPWYDDEANRLIKRFIRKGLGDDRVPSIADHSDDEDELRSRLANENCIVIGGPRTNRATELLLSRHFGAEPFRPLEANRRKIPFGFCWSENDPVAKSSSLTCSKSAREESKNQPGIAVKGGHVRADFLPQEEEYRRWSTEDGRDCGLVFVSNNQREGVGTVKLIILAGFTGVGTLGAAKALIEDFRYLEPLPGDDCVFGIVEVIFSKKANTTDRQLKDVRWKFRQGGHSPLKIDDQNSVANARDAERKGRRK